MTLEDGFQVGEWTALPREGKLKNLNETRHVRRKAMDVLIALAEQAGQVVERDMLLDKVWGPQAVSDEPLTSTIAELRRLLKAAAAQTYIETVPKRGYRLVAAIQPIDVDPIQEISPQPHRRRTPLIKLNLASLSALIILIVFIGLAAYVLNRDTSAPDRSIAVLPFNNTSKNDDYNYLADGLAEELTTMLTRIPDIKVAARNSAFQFRVYPVDVEAAAIKLNVNYVLSGSMQINDMRMRVNVQLMDTRDGFEVWSERYDRPLDDIFSIQEDVAAEISQQLSAQLLTGTGTSPPDKEAYRLFLQARYLGQQHTQASLERSAEIYRQSLTLDPDYAEGWAALSGLYVNMLGFALLARDEGYRLATEAAYKALALNPELASAHDRLGWIALHHDSNLQAAAEHYRRALTLEPGNVSVASNAAVFAIAIGKLPEAVQLLKKVAVLDPVSPVGHANLANAYLLSRRYIDAEQSIRNALTLSPEYAAGHYRLSRTLLAQGRIAEAEQTIAREGFDAARHIGEAMVFNATGDLIASDAALQKVKDAYGDAAAGNLAQVYAHRGDIETTFYWLDIEYSANGLSGFLEFRWDPVFDSVRDDPRWSALMTRIGMAETRLDEIPFTIPTQIDH